jgi:hypothetical protein
MSVILILFLPLMIYWDILRHAWVNMRCLFTSKRRCINVTVVDHI